MSDLDKIRPYEHLSEAELEQLADEAAILRLRLAPLTYAAVEASLTEHGCPANVAHRLVRNPMMVLHACRFHLDLQDAALGDPEAKARVEHMQDGWARLVERGAPTDADEAMREAELDQRYGR